MTYKVAFDKNERSSTGWALAIAVESAIMAGAAIACASGAVEPSEDGEACEPVTFGLAAGVGADLIGALFAWVDREVD